MAQKSFPITPQPSDGEDDDEKEDEKNNRNIAQIKGGYEVELVNEEIKELFCSICLMLMRDAVELGCGHSLCSTCLHDWDTRVQESGFNFDCPNCKELINKDKIKPNHTINRIITSGIKVKCPNCDVGCPWRNVISNIEDHLAKSCDYVSVPCLLDGCPGMIVKNNLENHLRVCGFRIVCCTDCKLSFIFNDFKNHEETCEKKMVHCMNNPCKESMSRELLRHHEEVCLHQLVCCPFKDAGCLLQVARHQLQQHQKDSTDIHLTMLMNELRLVKDEHRKQVMRLEEELETTKKQVNELRHVIVDQWTTNEIGRHLQSAMDKIFITMKTLATRIQDEVRVLNAGVRDRVIEFDRSHQLLEGQLNEFNRQLKRQVDEVADLNASRVAEYANLNMEEIFMESVRTQQTESRRDIEIKPETKENLKLSAFINEHKELAGRLHFELANIHRTLVQPTYGERFRAMLDMMEGNTRIRTQDGRVFLMKVEMQDAFEDEWNLVVLKKPTMFTEYKNMRHHDLLVNNHSRVISIMFPEEGLFVHDVPCVNVCSPRKVYKLSLPNVPKDDFRFRINFTTLKTSRFVENGFLLLRIHEVPRILVDSNFFARSASLSTSSPRMFSAKKL